MKETGFNLASPPGFAGLAPDLPITVYHRHLPHWRQLGATYFVTFRLADSLPQERLDFLKRLREEWERTRPLSQNEEAWREYAREFTNSAERWLDEGYGACLLRELRWRDDLRKRLHHFQDQRYFLSCWVCMPNHCHAVIRPFQNHDLEDLVGAMKGVSARNVNRALGTTGAVWAEECYDRIIRDEEHLWRVIQYIGRNPRLAGLADDIACHRWIHPDWEAVGWRFLDDG